MTIEEMIITILGSSLIASILGSFITQWYKIRSDKEFRKFLQKEERFFNILRDVGGFRAGDEDITKKESFVEAYRQIWLYASDETINSINNFFMAIGGTPKKELTEANKKYGEMILQLRKDFYGKTELKPEDCLLLIVPKTRP